MKHYLKTCDKENVGKNIDYFTHKKGFPHDQAVAASIASLKRGCGVKSKKKLSVKNIVDELRQYLNFNSINEAEQYNDELHRMASDPSTSPEQLSKIYDDNIQTSRDDINKALALNPNTPPDLLFSGLAFSHPEHVNENPSLPLFFLENPNFLDDHYTSSIDYLLRAHNAPEYLFHAAANHPDVGDMHHYLSTNKNTPTSALQAMANKGYSGSPLNSISIANHKNSNPNIAKTILDNAGFGKNVNELTDTQNQIQLNLLQNSKHMADLFDYVKQTNRGALSLANNKYLKPEQYAELAKHPEYPAVRMDVAKNFYAPKEVIQHIADNDPNERIRALAKKHPTMQQIKKESIFKKVKFILEALEFGDSDQRNDLEIASDPKTNTETLGGLRFHKDPAVRDAVANNPNTKPEHLGYLASEGHTIENNPVIPLLDMEDPSMKWLGDPVKTLRHGVNPSLERKIYFDRPDKHLRDMMVTITKDPDILDNALIKGHTDPGKWSHSLIAMNKNADPSYLRKVSNLIPLGNLHGDFIFNPNTPSDVIEKYIQAIEDPNENSLGNFMSRKIAAPQAKAKLTPAQAIRYLNASRVSQDDKESFISSDIMPLEALKQVSETHPTLKGYAKSLYNMRIKKK